jgi:hypothetical protein
MNCLVICRLYINIVEYSYYYKCKNRIKLKLDGKYIIDNKSRYSFDICIYGEDFYENSSYETLLKIVSDKEKLNEMIKKEIAGNYKYQIETGNKEQKIKNSKDQLFKILGKKFSLEFDIP